MTPQSLIGQVTRNCEITSAGQAGHFSLCGLLLRLRQLYKWEHGLPPWREPAPADVLPWVEAREQSWGKPGRGALAPAYLERGLPGSLRGG